MFKRKEKIIKEYAEELRKWYEDKYKSELNVLRGKVRKLEEAESLRSYLEDIKKLPDITDKSMNAVLYDEQYYLNQQGVVRIKIYTEEYFGPRVFANGMGFKFVPKENDAKNKRFTYSAETYASSAKVSDGGRCLRNELWEPVFGLEGI